MMNKKVIVIVIILIIVVFGVYQGVLKDNGPKHTLAEVVYGNVSQEVSETGQVQMGKAINLSFKNAGTIERIYVSVGDRVLPGSNLAKLNTAQFNIERNEALANFEVAQAKLNQLLEGATAEEVKLVQTEVANAQTALYDAQQEYEENLKQVYDDAANVLDSAFLEAVGAQNTVVSIRKKYFSSNDQVSIVVKEKEENIKKLVVEIGESINSNDVAAAFPNVKKSLNGIYSDLGLIRNQTETSNYTDIVLAADKASLDTERSDINTALANIVNAQQAIVSAELTGSAAVNTAQGKLNKAKDELAFKTAQPSPANIALYQAQVKQAQAKVDLLDNQIWEATLRSSVQGQVIEINKRVGETWQPSLTGGVMTLLPTSPYEIEVDIYEEDIVKMAIGNEVSISLVALPDEVFQGKVIAIDPAEELIEGVVYYTVTVNFTETPEGLRPGMTADLSIKTAIKENVLIIPQDAVQTKDGKKIVQVFQDNQIEDREVAIGLAGTDDMVEVIAGLIEGEKVIIK